MTDVLYLATDNSAVSVALVAIVVAVPLLLLAGLVFVAYTRRKARGSRTEGTTVDEARRPR